MATLKCVSFAKAFRRVGRRRRRRNITPRKTAGGEGGGGESEAKPARGRWSSGRALCKQRYISELLFDLQIGGRCPRTPQQRAERPAAISGSKYWMDGCQFFNSRAARARRSDAE